MGRNRKDLFELITGVVLTVGLVTFVYGLAQLGYAGTFSRYWADDYCYSGVLNRAGLVQGIIDWYETSGNRVSTLVVVSLSELFGQSAIRYIPLAVLILWVAACIFFLSELLRVLGWKTKAIVRVGLFSAILVYFTIYLAPDRMQSFYWRMGTLHYTLPLPILLITLGLLAMCWRKSKLNGWLIAAAGLLSFFSAGLSETFAALQMGLFLMILLFAAIFRRGPQRMRLAGLLSAPFLGTAAMMIIMALSPSNAFRQEVLPPPDNLLQIIPVSLKYGLDFVFLSLRGRWFPYAIYVLAVFLISILALDNDRPQFSIRASLIGITVSALGAYALIVCSFAPSAYGGLNYPAGRALMPASFVLLAGLAGISFFVGMIFRQIIPVRLNTITRIAVLALLLGVSLYPLRSQSITQAEIEQLSARAARWDVRNAQILNAIADGQTNIVVKQTDIVRTLGDLGPDSTDWINNCATMYYGVDTITANP